MKAYLAKALIAAVKGADGNVPEWYTIFPAGWVEIEGEGKALADAEAAAEVIAHFKRRGNDVVVDYEHQTLTGQKAPAAGWIQDIRWQEGEGIQARIEWTDAKELIAQGGYRYFSPAFFVRKTDNRVVSIHSVALTNAPKINHLTPLLAKLGAEFGEEDTAMEFLKKLAAKLGITGDPDEAKVEAAVDAVIAKNTQLEQAGKNPEVKEVVAKEVLAALDLKETDTSSTVVASIHALKQSTTGAVSRAEFDALQKELRERDATAIVASATAGGKITPDQKEWAMEYARRDLEGFKTFVAKAPVVIPHGALPRQDKTPDAAVDAAVLTVAKLMGNTPDDLKKFSGLGAE